MTTERMIEVLEALIEDRETNATAKCTAIRTLREIQAEQPRDNGAFAALDEFAPRRRGSDRRRP